MIYSKKPEETKDVEMLFEEISKEITEINCESPYPLGCRDETI